MFILSLLLCYCLMIYYILCIYSRCTAGPKSSNIWKTTTTTAKRRRQNKSIMTTFENTTTEYFEDTSILSQRIFLSVYGLITFLLNVLILIYITRLFGSSFDKRDTRSFFIQLLSISVNDTLTGLSLFTIAVIHVEGPASIRVCAYSIFFVLTLQNASQGSITCVSVHRYMNARNIRRLTSSWQSIYTKTLIGVSLIIALGTFSVYLGRAKIREVALHPYCDYEGTISGGHIPEFRIFFVIGIVFAIATDVLTILTLIKLRSKVKVEFESGEANPQTSRSQTSQQTSTTFDEENTRKRTIMARQKKASVTLFLILISFNIAFLPSILSFLAAVAGIPIPEAVLTVMFYSITFNSLFNPIIIASRTQDIRNRIRKDIARLRFRR